MAEEKHWYYIRFDLEWPIRDNDFERAKNYLTEDDMTEYLKDDNRIPQSTRDRIEHIEWKLQSEDHGVIEVIVNGEKLTDDENKKIVSWISGQNSDGLMEGFEQIFAYDINNPNGELDIDDDEYEGEYYVMPRATWYNDDDRLYEAK